MRPILFYSNNEFLQRTLESKRETLTLEEVVDILELEHGLHLAELFRMELEIITLQDAIEKGALEHGKSLALLFENEVQKCKLEDLNAQLAEANKLAYKAGMADIATDALHNVGNILTSVVTSINSVAQILEANNVGRRLERANELLYSNIDKLEDFIVKDPKGKKLMQYYLKLGESISEEQKKLKYFITRAVEKVNVVLKVIAAQQSYVEGSEGLIEKVDLAALVDDALTVNASVLSIHDIKIEKEFEPLPTVLVQRNKLMQIILNLLSNSREALLDVPNNKRQILIRLFEKGGSVFLEIKDTGKGIQSQDLQKIFNHGFTTKPGRNGFGLHNSANYMAEMQGKIWAESQGENKGATFFLELPLRR